MMENAEHERCVPTESIRMHAMDCEDEELEECQRSYYSTRFEEYAELLSLVKSYQTLPANSPEKSQLTTSLSTTSESSVPSRGIKPVDINFLLQPAVKSLNNPQAVLVSASPSTLTSPSSTVNLANGKHVRLQLVSSSSLAAPSQICIASPQVRIAVPSNASYLPAPAICSYGTHQLAQRMNGLSQPLLARPAINRATNVNNQQPSPSVRAVHSLPQQPINSVSIPPIRPTRQPMSPITTPWIKQSYSSGRLAHSDPKLPETQPRTLSNTVAIAAPNVASYSHLQKALLSTVPENPVLEERRSVIKPVITYGPASSQNTSNPVSPSPPVSMPPPSTPAEPNVGKSLPLLPCSIPEQNQDKRHTDPANGIDPPLDLVDLTKEGGSTLKSNYSRKASCGKGLDSKIFPSLVVVARPSLSKFSAATVNADRQIFDAEIRKMLACPVRQFIKRLFRLGLLLSGQQCEHGNPMTFREPPLWVTNCCPDKSVFANSVFEGSSLSPVIVIKLLYHWACNTNVQNVMYWVNVENVVVRTYYTNFRAVCSTVVQENVVFLGGRGRAVQIGVISLGTTPEDNGPKEVKLDILAVLEEDKKRIRLKALDNSEIQKNWDEATIYKYKFKRIAGILKTWVDPESTIILDFVVDHKVFHDHGFRNVVLSENDTNCSNGAIMSYLRRSIPQMFQNTLSLLSINIIQQFLDELVWREIWGPIPPLAYENLVVHIAEIMKLPGPPIIEKLKLIAQNPSNDWRYCVWKKWRNPKLRSAEAPAPRSMKDKGDTIAAAPNKRAGPRNRKLRSAPKSSEHSAPDDENEKSAAMSEPAVPPSSLHQPLTQNAAPRTNAASNARQISLELYYYGFIGSPVLDRPSTCSSILCTFCSTLISTSELTKHLIAHALDAAFSWHTTPYMKKICWYCFNAVSDIKTHVDLAHPPPRITPTTCRICTIEFKESALLIEHMAQTHNKLDMPYQCWMCEFRTSIYEEILTHFQLSHENDSCAVCPFCLKVVEMVGPKSRLAGLQNYFVQHIQKHRIESLNKKCEKCVLSFVNHDCLKKHQETQHNSCKNSPNLTRYRILPSAVVMMDRPSEPPIPPITLTESNFHTLQGRTLPLPQFTLDPEILSLNCLECDGPISETHYTLKLKCTKCAFTSHCANAIREHSTRAHTAAKAVTQRIGGIPTLNALMYCSKCDFNSKNGNRLAEHLAECDSFASNGQRGSYPLKSNPKKRRRT